jgi:hypothetical protein
MHPPEQAYLVVYLACGVVTGYEIAVSAERARQKCLAHVGRAMSGGERGLECGAFSVEDRVGRGDWGFAVTTGDRRAAGEEWVLLECLCGWAGMASDAGWDAGAGEWVCPGCGAREGLRVTD